MRTIDMLKTEVEVIKGLAKRASSMATEFQKKVEIIERDDTRTPKWKAEQIAPIRQLAIESFSQIWDEIRSRYVELDSQREFWASPELVMGRYAIPGFTPGTPDEAAVRSQLLTEFRMMHTGLLKIEARSAAQSRNWARLYLLCLVMREKGESLPVNLASLPIGKMEEADEVFYEAELALRSAELDLSTIRGQRESSRMIALGLLKQRHEELRRTRAATLDLLWDEKNPQEEGEGEAFSINLPQ